VFENRVFRKIFERKREELTGEWRRLHNEELHYLYPSPNIVRAIQSRRIILAGHIARKGDRRGAYRVLVGRPEGRRPLGRPRPRWGEGIKVDLKEVGWVGMDWIDMAQDRNRWRVLVNTVMNLRVPQNAENFLTSWGTVSFSRRTPLHGVS
jgi:hypothetical protein